jgi:DNA polymerase-3 subunit delta
VKANKQQIERALKSPGPEVRFFLLYGPDEAGSRALAKTLAVAMGGAAERVDLTGSELKSDPARLPDEAASLSLFGSRRYVWVEPAGDESMEAAQALVDAEAAGNPVVMLAGALKPTSKLLKLAIAAPCALAFASYVPEGIEADKVVQEMARALGLMIRPDIARRIGDAAGGNRGIIEQELSKIALFLDAGPERPLQVEQEVLDAIGAASEEGDLNRLVDSVSGGDAPTLELELLRLAGEGVEGIALIRAVLRRMSLLAKLRAEVERGNSVDSVMASHGKSLFWKEKPVVAKQLMRWRSDVLAKGIGRLLEAERQVKAPGGLGPVAVSEELFAICRQASRHR